MPSSAGAGEPQRVRVEGPMAMRAGAALLCRRAAVRTWALLAVGLVAALVLAAGVALLRGGDGGAAPARALVIAAQDMRFNGTNLPIELKVGEKVALTIVNRDGVPHNFVIAGLGVRTTGYLPPGGSQVLVFTPSRAGSFTYSCSLHPGLMDGRVVVRQE